MTRVRKTLLFLLSLTMVYLGVRFIWRLVAPPPLEIPSSGTVVGLQYIPRTNELVVAYWSSDDCTAQLWDLSTLKRKVTIPLGPKVRTRVVLDEKRWGYSERMKNRSTKPAVTRERRCCPRPNDVRIEASGNGKVLAVSGWDDILWNLRSGRMIRPFSLVPCRRTRGTRRFTVSPDGDLIAYIMEVAGRDECRLHVAKATTGEVVWSVPAWSSSDVAFDGQGDRIAAWSGESELRVWDVRTGEVILKITGPHAQPMPYAKPVVAFSNDCRLIAWVDSRCRLRVYDMFAHRYFESEDEDAHAGVPHCIKFSPDDRFIAVGLSGYVASYRWSRARVFLWDISDRTLHRKWKWWDDVWVPAKYRTLLQRTWVDFTSSENLAVGRGPRVQIIQIPPRGRGWRRS